MSLLIDNIKENIVKLSQEAKEKYEKRQVLQKYAREIETELVENDEEISIESVPLFHFGEAFGIYPVENKIRNNKTSIDLILEYLSNNSNKTATSAELQKYFIDLGRSTPAPTLSIMVKNRLIENISRGVYRLVQKS